MMSFFISTRYKVYVLYRQRYIHIHAFMSCVHAFTIYFKMSCLKKKITYKSTTPDVDSLVTDGNRADNNHNNNDHNDFSHHVP